MNRNIDEEVIANMLSKVVGDEVMLASFFNNDSTTVLKQLLKNCENQIEVKKMFEQMEYNRKTKNIKSNLADIQEKIIKNFGNERNINDLELNAVTNFDIIGSTAVMHPNLEKVQNVINIKKNKINELENSNNLEHGLARAA